MRERKRCGSRRWPPAAVATNDHLASEIISWLPAKSVVRLKSVCRRWFSLASDPLFLTNHTHRNLHATSGLILVSDIHNGFLYSSLPLSGISAILPDPSLSFITHLAQRDGSGFHIWCSGSGLIFCCASPSWLSELTYYVCNPTTMESKLIRSPVSRFFRGVGLAFRSPGYRVVCIGSVLPRGDPLCQIEIYSSEKGTWELSGQHLPADEVDYRWPVYWNGEMNWVTNRDSLVAFDIERQLVRTMPLPPIPQGLHRRILYFGESHGHLHLIEVHRTYRYSKVAELCFDIMELMTDGSGPGWCLIYRVDLSAIKKSYPRETDENRKHLLKLWLASFVRGEDKGKDDTLLLCIPENILSYNLRTKIFSMVCAKTVRRVLPYFNTLLPL